MSYNVGDIFYSDEDYSNKASFCNANNLVIVEIEPDKKGRRFQIQEIPAPSEKDLALSELHQLEEWFNEYDVQVMQYLRTERLGLEFDKDISELDAQAVANATRIAELRQIVKN